MNLVDTECEKINLCYFFHLFFFWQEKKNFSPSWAEFCFLKKNVGKKSLSVLSPTPHEEGRETIMVWRTVGDRWLVAPAWMWTDRGRGSSHAVAKARLSCWLGVTCRCLVAVAVRLLRGHGHAGTCCQHELRCSCNTQIHRSSQI